MTPDTERAPPNWPEAVIRVRGRAPLLMDMLINEMRRGRLADQAEQRARAARVGNDNGVQNGRDYGAGIRQRTIRARGNVVLRLADTEIEDGPDPGRPNATVRRARRTDPLVLLHKIGTIDGRSLDAAEALRSQIQAAESLGSGGNQSEIHLPAYQRLDIPQRRLDQCMAARKALASVSTANRPVVLWAVLGGTIAGYARFARVHHLTASGRLTAGMTELADHYYRRTVVGERAREAAA